MIDNAGRIASLDGSLVPAFEVAFADRLKCLISYALRQKAEGIGVFSRPEADPGLFQILSLLDKLEPQAGWIDKALVTYICVLDDALRSPRNYWWNGDASIFGGSFTTALCRNAIKTLIRQR